MSGAGIAFPVAQRIDGTVVSVYDFSPEAWSELQRDYRVGDLVMRCCAGAAIPKTSANGNPFFAHAAGACTSSPESQWHLAAKALVHGELEQLGCSCEQEAPGRHGDHRWQADVYAERDGVKLAVEIQHSYQHLRDYRARQARYDAAGVRCLWLLTLPRYKTLIMSSAKHRIRTEFGGTMPGPSIAPCLRELPVAFLTLDDDAVVSGAGGLRASVPDVLAAVLEGRFQWVEGNWRISG